MTKNKLSIITSTYEAENYITCLIKSLKINELYIHEWIVIDNFSTDSTISIIKKFNFNFKLRIIKKKSSIYEAFNEGIKLLSSKFYMILGADDYLLDNGISIFFKNYKLKSDIFLYVLPTLINGKIVNKKYDNLSIFGASHLVNSHSAGLIINKLTHDKVGFYSTKYFFASDSDFIIKIFKKKLNIKRIKIPIGCFGTSGSTNKNNNLIKILIENYKIMLNNDFSLITQTIILILRFIKNSYRLF